MSVALPTWLGPRTPAREELLSIRERAAFIVALRAVFGVIAIAAAALLPGVLGVTRLVFVAATLTYVLATALPQTATRLGRGHAQTLFGATLLVDGLYLAWVMSVTGGVESPFRALVFAHVVVVTLLVSSRTGLKVALWHTLLFLLLFESANSGFALVTAGSLTKIARSGSALRVAVWFQVGSLWLVALAASVFSSVGERELRGQKVDLVQLSEMVEEIDHLERSDDIARALLNRLQRTFGLPRGVVVASPSEDLRLVAAVGDVSVDVVEPGLDGAMDRAWASGEPVLVRRLDPSADRRLATLLPGARNVLVVPMFADRGYRLGLVAVEHPSSDRIRSWTVRAIHQFTSHAAMAMHHAWLLDAIQEHLGQIQELKDQVVAQNLSLETRVAEQTQELQQMVTDLREVDSHRRRLMSHIVTAQEEERHRIAGDVHDDPVQRVVALNMRLQLLRRALSDPEHVEIVDKLLDSVGTCIRSLRHLLFELRSPTLDEQGLGAAIREYVDERDAEFAYRVADLLEEQPPSETRVVLYRIAQEAIANVCKHAQASELAVTISGRDGGFLVEIQDNGVGFGGDMPATSARGHLGLSSMRERAELAGGWCEILSLPGEGTTVRFFLPATTAVIGNGAPPDEQVSEPVEYAQHGSSLVLPRTLPD
jgi:signal transduction histidine kinase